MRLIWIFLVSLLVASPVMAQEKRFTLAAPERLVESGLLQYVLPRFSLKTGIRITVVTPSEPYDAAFGSQGIAVFKEGEELWHLDADNSPHTDRFRTWLRSDVGRRTVESFRIDGVAPFTTKIAEQKAEVATVFDGDPAEGEKLALKQCGRCHVVSHANRMKAIGSTPSFAVLRTFADWENRFLAFYVLKPHGAFTQIEGVTDPFSDQSPSPIVPIRLTLDDLDAVMAFVAGIAPADLGAPIVQQ